MRIDTTQLPQVLGLGTPAGQPGQTLPFKTLFSSPQEGDDETGTKAAPVLSQYVFGFDALGMFGLGGPAGFGSPLAPSEGQGAAPEVPGVAPDAPPPLPSVARQAPVAPVYASVSSAAFSAAPAAESAVAEPVVTDPAVRLPAAAVPSARPPGASARTFVMQAWPVGALQAPVVADMPVMASAARPAFSVIRTGDAAKDVTAPRKAQAPFRFEPETEAASGHVSITLSEGDEQLHIVAAAPGLSESDRQTLKTVADEAASEAGLPLGELRLNGAVIRHLSKTR